MGYIVLKYDDIDTIEYVVNEKIKEGYKPIGGVSIATWGGKQTETFGLNTIYAQAMIRENKKGD